VERKGNINRAAITLAIALATTAIVRSYLSIISLYHALILVLLTSGSTTREIYQFTVNSVKKLLILSVAMLMIAVAIPAFALAASTVAACVNGQQVLHAGYGPAIAHAGPVTGVMGNIALLVPQATNLRMPAGKLHHDVHASRSSMTRG